MLKPKLPAWGTTHNMTPDKSRDRHSPREVPANIRPRERRSRTLAAAKIPAESSRRNPHWTPWRRVILRLLAWWRGFRRCSTRWKLAPFRSYCCRPDKYFGAVLGLGSDCASGFFYCSLRLVFDLIRPSESERGQMM